MPKIPVIKFKTHPQSDRNIPGIRKHNRYFWWAAADPHDWSQRIMQAISRSPRSTLHHALWLLGFVSVAVASIWAATCHAQPVPSRPAAAPQLARLAPIVDGHPIQPRADQFSAPYGRPDVSDREANDVQSLYDSVLQHAHAACRSATNSTANREC
jgi:hypothetical protein